MTVARFEADHEICYDSVSMPRHWAMRVCLRRGWWRDCPRRNCRVNLRQIAPPAAASNRTVATCPHRRAQMAIDNRRALDAERRLLYAGGGGVGTKSVRAAGWRQGIRQLLPHSRDRHLITLNHYPTDASLLSVRASGWT